PSAAASDIFRNAPINLNLTEQQRIQLDLARSSDAATGVKIVQAASYSVLQKALASNAGNPAAPSKISLALADNVVLTAGRNRVVGHAGMLVWRGRVEGGGRVTLMLWGDGEMAGTVEHEGRYYSIRRISDGLHAIVELSDDRMPPEHPAPLLVSSDRFRSSH